MYNPNTDREAAARGARRQLQDVQGVHGRSPTTRAGGCAPSAGCCASSTGTPIPLDEVEPASRDREALQDRRDVARLDQPRGARDPRHRDEPPRRQVEHRRGRRGSGALPAGPERRPAPQRDQAGGLRPLRRHQLLPRQRRRAADQDGAGREARRGRPAARPQGRRVHRQDPPLDAGRRPDLAAAAPRHLLDRGSRAADPRSEERQRPRAHQREAGRRGRRRHGRRRRVQGEGRRRADQRRRRRHRRVAAARRSSTPASRGSSGSPRRSRCSSRTTCAAASASRPTASSRPAATSRSRRCSAPRSSASRRRRSSRRAAS